MVKRCDCFDMEISQVSNKVILFLKFEALSILRKNRDFFFLGERRFDVIPKHFHFSDYKECCCLARKTAAHVAGRVLEPMNSRILR